MKSYAKDPVSLLPLPLLLILIWIICGCVATPTSPESHQGRIVLIETWSGAYLFRVDDKEYICNVNGGILEHKHEVKVEK